MQWNLLTTRWSSVSSCYLYNTPKPVHRHITMHYSVWRVLWGGENNSFCVWELFSNCFFSSTALKVRMLQRLKITFIHFLRWRKKKKKQQEEKQWKTNLTKNPHQFRELKKKKQEKINFLFVFIVPTVPGGAIFPVMKMKLLDPGGIHYREAKGLPALSCVPRPRREALCAAGSEE